MKLTPAYLSSNFEGVKDLESIKLSGRQITHIDDISFLVNLKRLDLSGNALKGGESLSGLQYCKSLVWLDLSGNQLSDLHHLLGLRNLTVLNVSKNELTMVPEGISQLSNLKALIISDNQIKSLANITFPKGLNTIVLSRNQLESTDDAFLPLAGLEKLSLSHNRLHQWPNVRECWELKELRLNNNKLFKMPAGKTTPALTHLDLGHNAIKDETELLEQVKALRHLNSLNVKGNPVWSEDLDKALVKAIPSLQILNSRKVRFDKLTSKRRTDKPAKAK